MSARFKETKVVGAIKFGLLSPDLIRSISVTAIVVPETYDEEGIPMRGGVMDRRLGAIEPGVRCETCGNTAALCPGHFGHIELARPVIHPEFARFIHMLLRATCRVCGRLLLPQEEIDRVRERLKKLEKHWVMLKYRYAETAAKKAAKVTTCPHCGAPQYKIRFDKPYTFYEIRDGVQVRLRPNEVRERLERIPDEDLEALGFDPKNARPEWMVLTVLPVVPLSVRPSITLETGMRSEDDLTHKLVDVLRLNLRLKASIDAGAPPLLIDDLWDLLQYHVATYFDNELSGIPPAKHRSGRPLKTLAQRLRGKEGRFRGSLAGKRVDFSARTVISPDPNLSINEVGVPKQIAMILVVPEKVTEWNLEEMRKLVINGPYKYPGANSIIRPDGARIDLRFVKDRKALAEALKPGYIVERHLRDGDVVLFNRQPSLHRMSIMAHLVRVLPGKTFRLNLLDCPPYNADFDGDEMNLHVPQNEEARAEAKALMLVQEQILSPRYGGPIIGAIHDYITGAYLLTRKDTLLDKKTFAKLAYECGYKGDLPEPAVLKPGPYWTGKQLVSLFLPKDFNYVGKAAVCAKCGRGAECKREDCENDAYVLVRNGELLMGVFDKSSLAAQQPETLLHEIVKEYGTNKARELMDGLFKAFISYLDLHGFTMGLDDIDIPPEVVEEIRRVLREKEEEVFKLIEKAKRGELAPLPGKTLWETLEAKIMEILSAARNEAGEIASRYLGMRKSAVIMARTGARANMLNITQMAAVLGQQAIRGERPKRGYTDRTLPHFKPGDLGPKAKGFVYSCFKRGLRPTEFFFHAMAGREGLVDTAVRTAQSGYMYRRLANALQDLYVAYDGSVRTAEGFIVQPRYGEDGVDPAKSDHGKAVNVEKLVNKVLVKRSDEAPVKPIEEDELRAIIENYSAQLPESLRKELYEGILRHELSKEEAVQVIEEAVRRYRMALVEPGEAVGIVAAQSIGEPATQMTLRTFHFAGVRELNVTLGLPRLIEIVDARRTPSTPIMEIYLEEPYNKDKEKVLEIARKIELVTIEKVARRVTLDYFDYAIIIELDPEFLEDKGVKPEDVVKALNRIKGKRGKVELDKEKLTVIYYTGVEDVSKLRRLKDRVLGLKLKGIKGITKAIIRYDEKRGEYYIITEGSNLSAVLALEGIDATRTKTNNIHEIMEVLGIEAARAAIIREMKSVLEEQGLDVDIRHIMLVADAMTLTGRVRQVGRHGVAGEKASVLARANFEVTIKHLTEAAVRGEVDELRGVTENVIVGSKPIPVGTGIVKLLMRYSFS